MIRIGTNEELDHNNLQMVRRICIPFQNIFGLYLKPYHSPSDQLAQIYDTTLAAIICRNSDAVNDVQRYVMRNLNANNPLISCSEIDTFSFVAWKEEPYHKNFTSVKTNSQQSTVKVIGTPEK